MYKDTFIYLHVLLSIVPLIYPSTGTNPTRASNIALPVSLRMVDTTHDPDIFLDPMEFDIIAYTNDLRSIIVTGIRQAAVVSTCSHSHVRLLDQTVPLKRFVNIKVCFVLWYFDDSSFML